MSSERFMHVDKLIDKYIGHAGEINKSNEQLLNAPKGAFGQKLKTQVVKAKKKHTEYQSILEELEQYFIGEIEALSHNDNALLAIKRSNQDAVSRARTVFLTSLQRFETTLSSIEDSSKFNKTVSLAKLSIFVALIPIGNSILQWALGL